MKLLFERVRRFLKADTGAIAAEFGLVISMLIVILMGCFEAARFILLHQKLDRASTSVADLTSQADGVSVATINDIYQAALQQTLPFDLAGEGRVIVSSIYRPDTNAPVVQWQCSGAGAFGTATSQIGSEGGNATVPAPFTVEVGENVIAAEVYYDYEPFIFDVVFDPAVFRHVTFTRPRGTLLVTDPGC